MNNRIIITATCFFLLVSFVFLSWSERKQADINTKNIWMVYFENPSDNSLNFKIENHSINNEFKWQILSDKNVVKEEKISVALGETKTIPLTLANTNSKVTVLVSNSEEKKEIYKIFTNN